MRLSNIPIDHQTLTEPRGLAGRTSKHSKEADFLIYLEQASDPLLAATPELLEAESEKPLSLKEEYFAILPDIGVADFGPPKVDFNLGAEFNRLAKIELKVQAMEEAGEIDKALDAFIGIHGLKDRLSREEKQELRDRFITLTKAVLLEDEWRKAYIGEMKTRIDVSIEGLREFLLGDEGKARMVDVGIETPYGDPDLMSFARESKWNNFNPPEFSLTAKADQMLVKARRDRER
ncbi:hypothetical protein [Pelagicoccus sp. SDUM812002]|uniref:hypothetical protein n=1 Tax=Pelagicoccus sp. SDUM812002 TaxID=3041266 RepID=UPI00280F7A27|nr:hypothetical protein [Pelagicoccus sp. SDUM812002]MDQ8183976.1 hypothetical protein [Pelagicoccus sp. SDUM812002]